MNARVISEKKKTHLPVFATVALVITLFLFFIDEGNYSFSGLSDIGNLIALGFYFVAMMLGQALLYYILRPRVSESLALRISLFAGSLGGAVAMALIFFLWMR